MLVQEWTEREQKRLDEFKKWYLQHYKNQNLNPSDWIKLCNDWRLINEQQTLELRKSPSGNL